MRALALLFVLLGACQGPPAPYERPDQAEATEIVWRQQYAQTRRPPRVEWVTGDELTCEDGHRFMVPGQDWEPTCVWGAYWDARNLAQVADWGVPISDTAFAHELNHARLWLNFGIWDTSHADPSFAPGGEVERANRALKEAGL